MSFRHADRYVQCVFGGWPTYLVCLVAVWPTFELGCKLAG